MAISFLSSQPYSTIGMIIFRAACSFKTGTGHLHRCLTLSYELISRGLTVRILTDDTPLSRKIASGKPVNISFLPEEVILNELEEQLRVFIVDIPPGKQSLLEFHENISILSLLNKNGVNIVSLGHVARNSQYFRAVIDLYPHRQLHAANYHEGPDYLILRKEFKNDPASLPRQNSILISMGGSDPQNLTKSALMILKKISFSGIVNVVLGVGYPAEEEQILIKIAKEMTSKVCFYRNISDMREQMRQAFLGMAAFGNNDI